MSAKAKPLANAMLFRPRSHQPLALLILGVLLVALPCAGPAANPLKLSGAISGTVTDGLGVPQMGATVEIFTSAALVGTTVFTDARGYYNAANLKAGTYQVKVTAASFLPSSLPGAGTLEKFAHCRKDRT